MPPVSSKPDSNGQKHPDVSFDPPDIENLMNLNPRVTKFANAVPSSVTKVNKKKWKRNADKAENLTACG